MANVLTDTFLDTDVNSVLDRLSNIDEGAFVQASNELTLANFHKFAPLIPAYKEFLAENGASIESVKTIEDYKKLPVMTKENYLIKYDLVSRCINGNLTNQNLLITSSSGTSGKPHFWPWLKDTFPAMAGMYELLYKYNFDLENKTTLILNCYGLGVWPAGSIIYALSMMLSLKGYEVTTINVGLDTEQALSMLRTVAPLYQQTVINGYPPFIKDLLDIADKNGIDLGALDIKILTGGERFTNSWRKYLLNVLKSSDKYKNIISLYASSEMGVTGFETPLSVFIRDLADENVAVKEAIFGEGDVTTLAQYNPMSKYVEVVDDRLIVSSVGGAPLFRYDMKDIGRIVKFSEIEAILTSHGVNMADLPSKLHVSKLIKLPFVTVAGRYDNTTTLYAVNIYPQHVEMAINNNEFQQYITGKFVMSTMYTEKQDQYLNIDIEGGYLVDVPKPIQQQIFASIIDTLKVQNSEFNKLFDSLGEKVLPKVAFKPFGSELFTTNNKHKYVRR